MELLRYIDVCINCNEHVEFEFIDKTPEGATVKVYINDDDMGDIALTNSEIIYYCQGLF